MLTRKVGLLSPYYKVLYYIIFRINLFYLRGIFGKDHSVSFKGRGPKLGTTLSLELCTLQKDGFENKYFIFGRNINKATQSVNRNSA